MIRDIKIHAVLNGYVVEVGCQTVVFMSPEALAMAIQQYLNNPEQTEKQYAMLPNAKHTLDRGVAVAPRDQAQAGRPLREADLCYDGPTTGATQYNPTRDGGPR